ncbi:hypothetical protein KY362_07410 [Candidatus Woesearchaeota archaeon]|nr:hypothetical protein [Candidatus Woesearchaeota archaeon]
MASLSIKGPVESGLHPDNYVVGCSVRTYDDGPTSQGFYLNIFARMHDGIVEGLASRPLAETYLEVTVRANELEGADSLGCSLTIPERRVCVDGAQYCYVVEEEHVGTVEASLDVVGEECLDWYYEAPDYEYRGGRNYL